MAEKAKECTDKAIEIYQGNVPYACKIDRIQSRDSLSLVWYCSDVVKELFEVKTEEVTID